MASGLIVLLLGCWLPGRSGVSAKGLYPKPSISVSPSGVIPVGGNVIIRCWHHQYRGMRFLLYKDGDGNYLRYTDPAGSEAEFPIGSVRWEQRGNYTCRYSDRTGDVDFSEPSDPVQIIVAGGTHPTQPAVAPAPTHPGSAGPGPGVEGGITIGPALETAAPPERLDFTHANIARLELGAVVLLVLGLILAEVYYSCPRGGAQGAWIRP